MSQPSAPANASKKKGITPEGYQLLGLIFALYVVVSLLMLISPPADFLSFLVRWAALMGYVSIFIATVMSNYMVEIYKRFGKPFVKIHHVFAIAGIILVTLHPVAYAIQVTNILVFVPEFGSWYGFWSLGGRKALILIYVAAAAGILRNRIKKQWRAIHALMYVALFFGVIHAIIIGTDFTRIEGVAMILLFGGMFAISILVFVQKRLTARARKQKKKAAQQS